MLGIFFGYRRISILPHQPAVNAKDWGQIDSEVQV